MKYLLIVISLLLTGCGQNRSKVAASAIKICHCRGAEVDKILYFGDLKAMIYCSDGSEFDIGDEDYVRECR